MIASLTKSSLAVDLWWVGFVSFIICYLINILLWRAFPNHRKLWALLLIYYAVPLGFTLVGFSQFGSEIWIPLIAHCILSANYIAVYPALQASSPTLDILVTLHRNQSGMTETQLAKTIGGQNILTDRISDLKEGKMLIPSKNQGEWKLSFSGNLLASFFLFYRRSLGMPMGEG